MKKFFVFLLTGLALVIAQSIWRTTIPWWNTAPDFVFIFIVYSGVYRSPFIGPMLAFLLGFVVDALWGIFPGLFASIYTLIFFIARLSGRRFYIRSYPFQILIIIAMTFAAKLLETIILSTLEIGHGLSPMIWSSIWRQIVWNALFATPVVMILEHIEQSFSEDYMEHFIGGTGAR